ncbi:hypothetical protein GCM10028819_24550 [Spirosoma humi]
MKFIVTFFRTVFGFPLVTVIQGLHVRLLNDWISEPGSAFLHPQCTWKLADGHPNQGAYVGVDFLKWYNDQLAGTYWKWNEVISDIIGSSIGGIIVGEYQFQYEPDGPLFTAPFTHFYKIRRGKITDIRYFMGKVSKCEASYQAIELPTLVYFCSLN